MVCKRRTNVKPSEIYKLPNDDYSQNLYWADQDLLQDVFGIEGLRHFEFEEEEKDEPSDLMQHRKLYLALDSDNFLSLYVLEFRGVPFAVVNHLATEHSGNDNDVSVTDRDTYEAARDWLMNKMRKGVDAGMLVDADEELKLDFKGARIATVRGEVKLLPRSHVGFHTGVAIFDEEAVSEGYAERIRPIEKDPGFSGGLSSPKVAGIAADIIADAVIADRKVLVGEFATQNRWIACFFQADGETYAATVEASGLYDKPVHWEHRVSIERVGFAPMFDLIESFHTAGVIDLESKTATDYAEAFELTQDEANMAIGLVAQGGGDFLEAAVAVIRERTPMPEGFGGDVMWVHARLLTEDNKRVLYGLGSMPSVAKAIEAWELRLSMIERDKAAREARAHRP
ncbi:hypothetical protein D3C71_360820 [compost metagenome]